LQYIKTVFDTEHVAGNWAGNVNNYDVVWSGCKINRASLNL